jgi:hypothetical protein
MKALVLVVAALMVPSVALAARSAQSHGKPTKHTEKVTYVLKGKLPAYTPYSSSSSANGTITITVSHSNYHAKLLRGLTLTFPLNAKSKITLDQGVVTIAPLDRGIVKVWAPKKLFAADLVATLQSTAARQVIDQGHFK